MSTSVKILRELDDDIKVIAKVEGISESELFRRALRMYAKAKKNEAAFQFKLKAYRETEERQYSRFKQKES